MKLIQRYLLSEFLPVLFVALLFFVLLLQLGDLFQNLWKYLSNEVSLKSILLVLLFYLPKCIAFALPLAVLFASSYTMGNFYARNELASVFAAGYPLHRLIAPLLFLGLLLSVFLFYFEDRVVIHTTVKKNALVKELLKEENSLSNTNIVIQSDSGRVVYTADYYQDAKKKLYTVLIVVRDDSGNLTQVIQSPSAQWNGRHWSMDDPVSYVFDRDGKVEHTFSPSSEIFSESPDTFRRNITDVEELPSFLAKVYIQNLRRAGLPYAEQLSNYYKRFSFPFTVFIVLFFSISMGGRFKKNIILMSLLMSLSIAVLFYVTQMITMLFAKWEYISPLAGAWSPVIIFIILSMVILKFART